MAESPKTPAPEPDSGDTASWLVEELVARGVERPAPAASDEDWGGVATEPEERVDPEDGVAPEDDEDDEQLEDEVLDEVEELAGPVAELRRELSQTTVELDRLAGSVREQVVAELDQRRGEWSIEGSAAVAEVKAQTSQLERRLLRELRATTTKNRKRTIANLQATATRLRAEVAEAEKRLGARFVDEVRSHAKALDRKPDSVSRALEAFSKRLDSLDEQVRGLVADAAKTQETLEVLARYRRHEPAVAEEKTQVTALDLNAAGFEDLRRIGLSVTQAKRVLTYRDRMGGFDTVERLREVPGLPNELLQRITPRTRV